MTLVGFRTIKKTCGGDEMARQEGDVYPDPSKRHLGRRRTKVLICAASLFICLGSFMTMVLAPGDQLPDPLMCPGTYLRWIFCWRICRRKSCHGKPIYFHDKVIEAFILVFLIFVY